MLTLKKLKEMEPGIFARGETIDAPAGANMANTGNLIKWVAVRGKIHDWVIYVDNPYVSIGDYADIARIGDKLYSLKSITHLVPCDKEAMDMYRD